MSEYLGQLLIEKLDINQETFQLVTKNMRSLNRQERRLLYGELRSTLSQVEGALLEAWDNANDEERIKWLELTADSIVMKGGDRDLLDKMATQLVGKIKVYNRVQKLSNERGIVLKVAASQGGCTIILAAAILIIGLALIVLNTK